ncbi:MAG: hypothetical protein ACRDP1_05055 [Nocardioidaceae bacterium]
MIKRALAFAAATAVASLALIGGSSSAQASNGNIWEATSPSSASAANGNIWEISSPTASAYGNIWEISQPSPTYQAAYGNIWE